MPSAAHDELVERGRRWLKSRFRCGLVLTEFNCSANESPDVLGFRHGGWSVLVEVKVSRADFRRDFKKPTRNGVRGMGQERWYLTPPGLVTPDELPEGWGLAEAHSRVVRVLHQPARTFLQRYDFDRGCVTDPEVCMRDIDVLYSVAARISNGYGLETLAKSLGGV